MRGRFGVLIGILGLSILIGSELHASNLSQSKLSSSNSGIVSGSAQNSGGANVYRFPKFVVKISPMAGKLPNNSFMYQCWNGPNLSDQVLMSRRPDLEIKNGVRIPDGSGGNYFYRFVNNKIEYRCYVTVIGTEDSPPAWIAVYQGQRMIATFNALHTQ